MKEWTKPEMRELNICNTEWNLKEGTVPDSDVIDHNTGAVIGPYMYSI